MIDRFNIRAYFLIVEDEKVLLSDEVIRGGYYTKFPGGGVELGEGIRDALHREAMEELNQEIELLGHFYTTDFFVQSSFRKSDQVVAIYYLARLRTAASFSTAEQAFDFQTCADGEERFRWISLERLTPETMSFPTDRRVVELLLAGL